MAKKDKSSKKKVVTTNTTKTVKTTTSVDTASKKIKPTKSKIGRAQTAGATTQLIFGKQNYILMGVGALLVGLGMLLMMGGGMPTPDVWDESIIYSPRRIVLAPLVILAGLVVEIVAIFKK